MSARLMFLIFLLVQALCGPGCASGKGGDEGVIGDGDASELDTEVDFEAETMDGEQWEGNGDTDLDTEHEAENSDKADEERMDEEVDFEGSDQDNSSEMEADNDSDREQAAAYNGCGALRGGIRAPGTIEEPIVVPQLPFFDRNSLEAAISDDIDNYGCGAESADGPEFVYRFETAVAGRLVAELEFDGNQTAAFYLLDSIALDKGTASGCLETGGERITRELEAGVYWLVVESGGADLAYRLFAELIVEDQWRKVDFDEGVIWSKLVASNFYGGRQTVNTISISSTVFSKLKRRPHLHGGCKKVSQAADDIGALAGMNASFFNIAACTPIDMVKSEGVVYSHNAVTHYTMGWNDGESPEFKWVDPDDDWEQKRQALGGHISLIIDGAISISTTNTDRHPRSALGLMGDGSLLLATFDGRTAAGIGMTLQDLAQFFLDQGAVQAVNLDGGGSSSMFVRDCSINGVVNYPSDNNSGPDGPDHSHERAVTDGLYLVE